MKRQHGDGDGSECIRTKSVCTAGRSYRPQLSLTIPHDACRSALGSRIFCAASQSDSVWNRFLPSDWQSISSRSNPDDLKPYPASSSKKNLYFRFCDNPLLIDDGKKSFALEKCSGKKCLMLGARDLFIVWSSTPHYWTWKPLPESRFAEVAALLYVWWLEIRGCLSSGMLSPATSYATYLVFKMEEGCYGGFDNPAVVTVGTTGRGISTQSVCLDPEMEKSRSPFEFRCWRGSNMKGLNHPKRISDGWWEVELGDFYNEGGDDEVEISLLEIEGNTSKDGLIVQGVEIRPKVTSACFLLHIRCLRVFLLLGNYN